MNEQLEKTVNEVLMRSIEAFDSGAEWMAGQIPEVVNQLLVWKFTISLIWFVVFFLVLIAGLYASMKLFKYGKEKDDEGSIIASIIFAALFIPICCVVMAANFDWLQILIAPKLYLLEYTANLVKQG